MARTPKKPAPSNYTRELGGTGLRQYSGYIDEEFHRELRGRQAIKIYREMSDNSSVVGAILFAVSMTIRQVDWFWEPADTPDGDDGAAFAEDVVAHMEHSFEDFITEALSFLIYGWSYFEVVFLPRDDGRIGIRKLALRAQDTLVNWIYDDTGQKLLGMQQQLPDGRVVVVPTDKALHFRTTRWKDNPEGRSMLRNAYRPWYFLTKIEEIEAIGIERDLCGMPVAAVPAEVLADAEKYEVWKRTMTSLRRDTQECLIIPSTRDAKSGERLYEVSLMSTGGRRQVDTVQVRDGYKKDIATTVLADFIFLGQQAVGSFALADSKTEMFAVALGGWLKTIAGVVNDTLIPRLWAVNGLDPDSAPKIRHGDLEKPDLEKLGSFVKVLFDIGVPVGRDEAQAKHLMGVAGLPIPDGPIEFPEQEVEPDDGDDDMEDTQKGSDDDDMATAPVYEVEE